MCHRIICSKQRFQSRLKSYILPSYVYKEILIRYKYFLPVYLRFKTWRKESHLYVKEKPLSNSFSYFLVISTSLVSQILITNVLGMRISSKGCTFKILKFSEAFNYLKTSAVETLFFNIQESIAKENIHIKIKFLDSLNRIKKHAYDYFMSVRLIGSIFFFCRFCCKFTLQIY